MQIICIKAPRSAAEHYFLRSTSAGNPAPTAPAMRGPGRSSAPGPLANGLQQPEILAVPFSPVKWKSAGELHTSEHFGPRRVDVQPPAVAFLSVERKWEV